MAAIRQIVKNYNYPILFLFILFVSVLSGCPFDDDDDYPLPQDQENAQVGVNKIPVIVELDGTGQVATVTQGDKVYIIDITGATGTLDPDSIDILSIEEVNVSSYPPGVAFPDGFIKFKVIGLTLGETITATITFPTAFPAGSEYYKVTEDGFVKYDNAVINGAVATLTLTDGLDGDLDKLRNGEILDPGAPSWDWISEGEGKLAKLVARGPNLIGAMVRIFVPCAGNNNSRLIKGSNPEANTQVFFINTYAADTAWTVLTDSLPNWVTVTPTSGTGSGKITVKFYYYLMPDGTSTVSVFLQDDAGEAQEIRYTVEKADASVMLAPAGSVDEPATGATVSGVVPIFGWAVDDGGIESVWIRNADDDTFYGYGFLLESPTPDIEKQYPDYPGSGYAKWYFDWSTLNLADGAYNLEVIAWDWNYNQTTIGTLALTVNNANATAPFGRIETPIPMMASLPDSNTGASFDHEGWALTPLPNTIPTDGSTINVYLDGLYFGHLDEYNQYNSTPAIAFPALNNHNGAGGGCTLDLTGLRNGVHSLEWIIYDDAGNAGSTGKRYFVVEN
ncbi:hypothetical protein Dalk_2157 [Desulfatibacillum aliphaticivorans]|uniref:BACON domain-containing protein n=1 Tax=Desulfatibacillum aliphaticivorans TaxID=218208 RepID=B8FF34_DESAL|nr:choice-of-anchor U domain-containing protein [Desulfatibacillum aliphaticivorans]ACL03851.1 hypothetical protein Dalk_2157 [Desulfatibacillum aliphaticivorans]